MYATLFLPFVLSIGAPAPEFKLTREEQAAIKALEPFGFRLGEDKNNNWPYGTVLKYDPCMGYDEKSGKVIWAPMPSAKALTPLAKLTRLRKIELFPASIVNDAMLDHLRNMSQLKYLYLRQVRITDEGMKKLAELRKLSHLDLTETSVSDAGLKAFAGHPALGYLFLRGTRVTDHGLKALQSCERLTVLHLGENKGVGDDGIDSLGKAPNLSRLYLGKTEVTDEGLARMAKPGAFPNLLWVSFSNTAITDKGLKLLHNPRVLPSLKIIGLGGTKVTEEGIKTLTEARPELEIGINGRTYQGTDGSKPRAGDRRK